MILSDLYRLVLHWRHNRSTFRKGRNEMEKNSTSHSTYCCVEEYFKFPNKMVNKRTFWRGCKVEKIVKGSLDLIPSPSPSVIIQFIGKKAKHCRVCYQMCIDNTSPSNVLLLHLKHTFPPIISIFIEGEVDGIKSRLLFKIFSTLSSCRWVLSITTIQKWSTTLIFCHNCPTQQIPF